jgi:hypothetical protein
VEIGTPHGIQTLDSGAIAIHCVECHIEIVGPNVRAVIATGWRAARPAGQAITERPRLPRYCPAAPGACLNLLVSRETSSLSVRGAALAPGGFPIEVRVDPDKIHGPALNGRRTNGRR